MRRQGTELLRNERMPPVGEWERRAHSRQAGLIDRHYHLQRVHRIASAALWLAIRTNGLQPVLHHAAIGQTKTALFGRESHGWIVLQRRLTICFASRLPLAGFELKDLWKHVH